MDNTYLSDDIYPKIPNIMRGMTRYEALTQSVLANKIPKTKRVFDNSKVTDHHAIIPTGVNPTNLTADEWKVYDLVAKRFISNFYPDCQISTTAVLGEVEKIEFKANGKQILSPGWRMVYDKEKSEEANDEEKTLPAFTKGEHGPHTPDLAEKWTTAPKPYTEATLLRAMETAGKQMEDGELRDLLKENGIGRPSTRANIIETLFKRNYMRKEKKNIYATQTGIDLINTIQQELLKSAELTGQWEKRLRMIEKSTYDSATFMAELKTMVTEIVQSVKYDTQRTITIEEKKAEEEKKKTPKPRTKAPKKEKTEEPQPATEAKQPQPQPQAQQAAPLPATIVGMTCPLCGKGTIVKGRTAYGCSEWKAGCALRLPIEVDGKEQTTEELLQQLRTLKQ